MSVNTKTRRAKDPASEAPRIRAFCSRNGISRSALAESVGTGRRYISDALHADTNGKAVSAAQLERIWAAVLTLARQSA